MYSLVEEYADWSLKLISLSTGLSGIYCILNELNNRFLYVSVFERGLYLRKK